MNVDRTTATGARGVEPLVSASEGVLVSSVKLADDRSGDLVVRLWEPVGRRVRATVRVDAEVTGVQTVSLLEEVLPDAGDGAPAEVVELGAGGAVELALGGFEVRTLRFGLARA